MSKKTEININKIEMFYKIKNLLNDKEHIPIALLEEYFDYEQDPFSQIIEMLEFNDYKLFVKQMILDLKENNKTTYYRNLSILFLNNDQKPSIDYAREVLIKIFYDIKECLNHWIANRKLGVSFNVYSDGTTQDDIIRFISTYGVKPFMQRMIYASITHYQRNSSVAESSIHVFVGWLSAFYEIEPALDKYEKNGSKTLESYINDLRNHVRYSMSLKGV